MSKGSEDDYEKSFRMANTSLDLCTTILAVLIAYVFGSRGTIPDSLKNLVLVFIIGLAIIIIISGLTIVVGRKTEPKTMFILAIISFVLMIVVLIFAVIMLALII